VAAARIEIDNSDLPTPQQERKHHPRWTPTTRPAPIDEALRLQLAL